MWVESERGGGGGGEVRRWGGFHPNRFIETLKIRRIIANGCL